MKKNLLTLVFLFGMILISHAQDYCLTDSAQKELQTKDFASSKRAEIEQARLLSLDVEKFLKSKGISISQEGQYVGPIYTIPIVVHVIVPNGEAVGTQFNPSDLEIEAWIERCNKVFDTTFGGSLFPEGLGESGGTVIPFKLVLAKRTSSCETTNGIVRYNATSTTLPNYSTYGINSRNSNGVSANDIRTFAPHWFESSYFNIYVINGFDGHFNSGGTGVAGFPYGTDSSYDAFMAYRIVINDVGILPHEMGHALGLIHIFGDNYDFATSPCPVAETETNCLTVNDKVCDTSPVVPYLKPFPDNTVKNLCTGSNYDGTQYNFMGYNDGRKFTPGQRERILTTFLDNRMSLTQSLGATPLVDNPDGGAVIGASCTITSSSTTSNSWSGPTLVKLGTINNVSNPRLSWTQGFYTDFTVKNCTEPNLYTNLKVGDPYMLEVGVVGSPQYINSWIDYNNNGSFEDLELVATSGSKFSPVNGFNINTIWSATITPPATAVIDTPLRLRVRASKDIENVCDPTASGQVEDYTITLRTSFSDKEQNVTASPFRVWYSKNENKIISNSIIGNYKIYDISGRLVQKGVSTTKEVTLTFSTSGGYIFKTAASSVKLIL